MDSKASGKGKGTDPSPERTIFIVGPATLQNDLLSSFLEREMGSKCYVVKNLREIQESKGQKGSTLKFVLRDCHDKTPDALFTELESDGRDLLSDHFVTLFNVPLDARFQEEAVGRGVRGLFYEQTPLEHFLKGINSISNGELWLSRDVMTKCILRYKRQESFFKRDESSLTPRELEILSMIAGGSTNEGIAAGLYISPHTVKTHIYNIFKKINVPNRLQAALWAVKNL